MLDQASSQRLNLLRFPLIVGVVFIHAYSTSIALSTGTIGISQSNFITNFVMNVVSQGIARVAVPLFFLMSGYLFFFEFGASKAMYIKNFRIRIRTLLVPFLFWNLITLLFFAFAQAMPVTNVYFSGAVIAPIASYDIFDYFINIFGIGKYPISYQFWFIRDLMLLVLLTPIIQFMNKRAPVPFLLTLFFCWILNRWLVNAPSSDAILFFSVGAFLGGYKKSLFTLDKHGIAITTIYLPIVIIGALFPQGPFASYLHKIGIVFGVIATLFSTQWIMRLPHMKKMLFSLSEVSFFVFAAHEPLQVILRKLSYKILLPETWMLVLALYFIVPIFVIAFLLATYRILSGITPGFLSVITGGRKHA